LGASMSQASWQPRALKKRGAEFVVPDKIGSGAPGAACTAPSAPAEAQTSTASFGGAADLDDLDEEGPTKRSRLEVEAQAPSSGQGEPRANGPSSMSTETPRDEIIDGAPRLAAHITSASKFNKVAAMAFALLEGGRVTSSNASAFFAVLQAGMLEPHRLRDRLYRVAYRKLYAAAIARAALFPPSAQPLLRQWEVQVLTQIDLHTDDTYQFNRAAKEVRERLTGLPCIYPALEPTGAVHLAEADRLPWSAVLFDCVGAAMAHHKYPWAKTTCDMLVKAAVDRRQNFTDAQQEQLQVWNATCKGQRIMRQQEHSSKHLKTGGELTSFERAEDQWRQSDIASAKRGEGSVSGGGLDGWVSKQSL